MFDRHPAVDSKVIVNLFSGNAIEGVCTRVKPTYLVRAAVLHQPGVEATQVDGEISIDLSNVDFVQILDGG